MYLTGTQTKATLYADAGGTILGNPFTANTITGLLPGKWIFWAAVNQGYDVVASGGDAPNTYPAPVTLCADCYPNSQFVSATPLLLQHNSVNLTDQLLLNFNDSPPPALDAGYSSVKFLTDSLGNLGAEYLSSNIVPQVVPPISGQYVVIYPTTSTILSEECGTACGYATMDSTSGDFFWQCGGFSCTTASQTTGKWGGFALPSYVNPANVTHIYADAITSGQTVLGAYPSGGSNATNFACGTGPVSPSFGVSGPQIFPNPATHPWVGEEVAQELVGVTGAQLPNLNCAVVLGLSNTGPSGITVNVSAIRLIVDYTGDAPPVDSRIQIVPPLLYNSALNNLSLDPLATGFLAPFTVGTLPSAALWSGRILQVTNGANSTDCTTGGGSSPNLCRSDGTAWVIYSAGGGGAVASVSNSDSTLTISPTTGSVVASLNLAHANTWTAPISVNSASDPSQLTMTYNVSHTPTGLAGSAVYAPDTSGNATFNENNTGFSRLCTVGNGLCGGGGGGSVTSFAAPSGSWPTWLTPTVTNPTTTPSLAVAAATGQTSHKVLGTCGTATSFAPCSLVQADLPAQPAQLSTTYVGVPANSQIMFYAPSTIALTVPASCSGSYGNALVAATGSTAFLFKDLTTSTTLCTATYAASGTTATFSGTGGSVSAGDVLEIIGPATADATLATIGVSIYATR